MLFDVSVFFENLSGQSFIETLTIITGALREDQCIFIVICRSTLLRMINFSDKIVEKIKTPILYSITFTFLKNRTICEIIWKNIVEPDRPDMTIGCMRIVCWIPEAANTHSQYVKLIAFPMQEQFGEHATMFRYSYIVCLV